MATPLLLYLINEASSGTTPTSTADSSTGTAVNMSITFSGGGAWTSIGAGKGFSNGSTGQTSSGALSGTKVQTAIAGAKKLCWEQVLDFTGAGFSVAAGLEYDASNAAWCIVPAGPTSCQVFFADSSVGTFTLTTGVHVITIVADTTQALAVNRISAYVDGVLTAFGGTPSFPSLNAAFDSAGNDYTQMLACLTGRQNEAPFGGKVYYAALYGPASIPTPTEIAANATALLLNNDANPNSSSGSTVAVATTVPVATSSVTLASTNTSSIAATVPVATSAITVGSINSLAAAATVPVATSAIALGSTDSLAVAATVPVATSTIALISGNPFAVAATIPVPTLAANLGSTNALSLSSTVGVPTLAASLGSTNTVSASASVPVATSTIALTVGGNSTMTINANVPPPTIDLELLGPIVPNPTDWNAGIAAMIGQMFRQGNVSDVTQI